MGSTRTGSRTIFFFCLLLLLALAGEPRYATAAEAKRSGRHQAADSRVTCPPRGEIGCTLESQPSEDEVRGAVQSLYFYAYKWGVSMPRRLKPMPLDGVVCTLIRDQSPRHEARRRLAIMKLVGSLQPLRQLPGGAVVLGPPEFCTALIGLSAPLDKILLQVGPLIGGRGEGAQATKAKKKAKRKAKSMEPQPRPKIEQATEGVLVETAGPLKTNCAVVEDCSTPQDGPAQANGIGFTIKVQRSLAAVEPVMDPQAWDDCNTSSFEKTYITGQPPVIDSTTGDAQPASSSPAPGSMYGSPKNPLPLFEYYVFNPCGTPGSCASNSVSFKNILNIVAQDGQDPFSKRPQHEIDYKLDQCIQSVISGSVQKGTGIDIDQGFVTAIDDGTGATDLSGQKFIRFSPGTSSAGLNIWAQVVLPLLCDEVAGKSGGGVCCDLGQ